MCCIPVVAFLCLVVIGELGLRVHPSGSSGLSGGDPAPGRSPGPPADDGGHRVREGSENSVGGKDSEGVVRDPSTCVLGGGHDRSGPQIGDRELFDFKVTHSLFKTDVLVIGVVYEGKLARARARQRGVVTLSTGNV